MLIRTQCVSFFALLVLTVVSEELFDNRVNLLSAATDAHERVDGGDAELCPNRANLFSELHILVFQASLFTFDFDQVRSSIFNDLALS